MSRNILFVSFLFMIACSSGNQEKIASFQEEHMQMEHGHEMMMQEERQRMTDEASPDASS
ncbi:MAG: hypothetical protein AAF944_18175 [Bacteroidota bacterium]